MNDLEIGAASRIIIKMRGSQLLQETNPRAGTCSTIKKLEKLDSFTMALPYTTKTINQNRSLKEEDKGNANKALRIFDYTPLAITMQDKEGKRPFFEEHCIKVIPGKINTITKNACKIMNGGGKGDPIVSAFNTQTRAPIINPIEYFENIDNFTPVLWGNMRGSKGIMQALDFLGKDYLQIDHAYFGRGHDKMNYRVSISSRFAGKPQWILGDRMNDLKN